MSKPIINGERLTERERIINTLRVMTTLMNKLKMLHNVDCTLIARRPNDKAIVIGSKDTLSRLPNKQEVIQQRP